MTAPGDTELITFGLTWAAQRYKVAQDPAAYDRLADRYGEPHHPLTRHARAAVHQDWDALAQMGGALPSPGYASDGQDDLASSSSSTWPRRCSSAGSVE